MTVRELIEELDSIDNQDKDVLVPNNYEEWGHILDVEDSFNQVYIHSI